MKRIFILLLGIITLSSSCQKDTPTVCKNLLKQGSADLNALKGEWEFERFAYSANGRKIKNQEPISKEKWIRFDNDTVKGGICNMLNGKYYLTSKNNISISIHSITYMMCDDLTNELESSIIKSLNNAHCFVIRDNELIIHYSGDKKKNTLILSKK